MKNEIEPNQEVNTDKVGCFSLLAIGLWFVVVLPLLYKILPKTEDGEELTLFSAMFLLAVAGISIFILGQLSSKKKL